MESYRAKKIKEVILTSPYFFYFVFIFILYIFLNIIINKLYITREVLFNNLKFGIPFILLNILIAGLIATNINLIIIKSKEFKLLNNNGKNLTFLGILGGFLGGACPGCFVGLFPAFLGLFGITASLSILPLYGFEIQIVSALLLILSIYLLTKNPVCEIELNKKQSFKKRKF